ncbi:hypothetical protein WL1483_3331 [Aeromonas schubertii]|uniref:Uncharacterized protein n=1 Tax=Aeromonas schubertii TaxID=652 RepID=A0A0S2SMM1_9GAMM|nr:hypothetical protein WL1483_3331 [Aeromonas schubertii]
MRIEATKTIINKFSFNGVECLFLSFYSCTNPCFSKSDFVLSRYPSIKTFTLEYLLITDFFCKHHFHPNSVFLIKSVKI